MSAKTPSDTPARSSCVETVLRIEWKSCWSAKPNLVFNRLKLLRFDFDISQNALAVIFLLESCPDRPVQCLRIWNPNCRNQYRQQTANSWPRYQWKYCALPNQSDTPHSCQFLWPTLWWCHSCYLWPLFLWRWFRDRYVRLAWYQPRYHLTSKSLHKASWARLFWSVVEVWAWNDSLNFKIYGNKCHQQYWL